MSLDAGAGSSGGSLLTTGVEPAAAVAQGGNPAGATGAAPPVNGAAAAVQAAQDGPPEWVIPKFWDATKAKDPTYAQEYAKTVSTNYQSLEKLLGSEKVPVPRSDDDEEGWNRWYAATGRPETPDAYEIERPANLPIEYDEDGEKAFRTWAHQNGLNKRQARNLYDSYVKTQIERHGEYEKLKTENVRAAQDALQREHGGKYSAKLELAKAALGKYADQDYLRYLDETGLGNDPRTIRAWIKIGEEMQGETRIQGRAPQAPNTGDLDRAIVDFGTKHRDALFNKEHPQHGWAVAERRKLYEQRFADA
jgi:hypothetical protein